MKYCDHCGKAIPDHALYCDYCGARQIVITDDSETPTEPLNDNSSVPYQASAYGSPAAEQRPAKGKKTALIAVAAAVLIAAVGLGFLAGRSGSDKKEAQKVEDSDKKKEKSASHDINQENDQQVNDDSEKNAEQQSTKAAQQKEQLTENETASQAGSVEAAQTDNADILHIRAVYNDITAGINNGTYIHFGDETAGGYTDRDHIVKRIDLSPGQSHVDPSSTEQYYYEYVNGKYDLVFVYSSVGGNDQNRYYFKDGTMIRWITPDKQYHSRDAEYNQREETLYSQGNREITMIVGRGD